MITLEEKNNKPAIKVENLTVRYGKLTVLENISFEIMQGEILVVVGGSGCGKSTLLRQLIGLELPTEGKIYYGNDEFTTANYKLRKIILNKFGVMFQSTGLFASMTIYENMALLLETNTNLKRERIDEIIEMKLASVGLNGYQNYYPNQISGGMKKRAALARAMTLDPGILFFDEPSSGLDPLTSASLDRLIIELNKSMKTTMIIITHDLASATSIAHNIIMLDQSVKGILAQGNPEKMLNYKENKKVYHFFNRIPEEIY